MAGAVPNAGNMGSQAAEERCGGQTLREALKFPLTGGHAKRRNIGIAVEVPATCAASRLGPDFRGSLFESGTISDVCHAKSAPATKGILYCVQRGPSYLEHIISFSILLCSGHKFHRSW